jgi:hypothetical protein
VKSERFVLPVLMQSDLKIAATLVARESKRFRFLRLLDCEDNQFRVSSHGSLKSPLCSCVSMTLPA